MITVKNILTEYPKIDQNQLPDELKADTFEFVEKYIHLYGKEKAKNTTTVIDGFIEKLNHVVSKQTAKKKSRKLPKKPLRAKRIKKQTKVKAKKEKKLKEAKQRKATKPKREKLDKKPDWLMYMRRFLTYEGKERTVQSLYRFTKDFQKTFKENPKRETTPHIGLIRKIQDVLVEKVNKHLSEKRMTLHVSVDLKSEIKDTIAKVSVAKQTGKENLKSETLSGLKKKEKPEKIKKSKPKNEVKALNGIIGSIELVKTQFDSVPFTGKWEKLIGKPTRPFHLMFYGKPGSGKSTLTITFAHYLAAEHNFKVLFIAKEEGKSGTTKDKFVRLKASHQNIDIAENIPCCNVLDNYDVIVLDSVNELHLTPDDIRRMVEKHPNLSTVQIFKATKEGKFLGVSDFAHLIQAEFVCENGKVKAEKNRFGGNEEIDIF
jgi:hypothetical protein